MFPFRPWCEAQHVLPSLKPTAEALGIKVIEVDRERMGDLTPQELAIYNASDVNATLALAQFLATQIDPNLDSVDPRITR